MNGILTISEATAATIRMDRVEGLLNAAMSTDLGGFEPRNSAAKSIRGLAEILSELARRIDPIESGDFAIALKSGGERVAISIKIPI